MAQKVIQVSLPSDILSMLDESEDVLVKRIKISLAIQLYSEGKVTIGKAAQIADMPRLNFENLLADHQIPISSLAIEDVWDDIRKLQGS